MTDTLQRFIFDDTDVRGEIVTLEQSFQDTLSTHVYSEAVTTLLGEFLAAATLLSATLKFDGTLTLQASSKGAVPMIMAEASSQQQLRAIAKGTDLSTEGEFQQLLTDGQLCITIDPRQGKRYQGIVSLEGDNLARCIESYFQQSEQLSTRIWLAADNQRATGLLLQELPANKPSDVDARQQQWQHLETLADTISGEELLTLDAHTLLHRLYHQETVRLFEPSRPIFKCSCSEQRTLQSLTTIGQDELNDIIREQGEIAVNCEFCHQKYHFDQARIDALFAPPQH
jgi:molecular chaperone Hsp33